MDALLIALLDANILLTLDIRDTILIAAERGVCTIYWTDEILGEVERNFPKVLRGSDAEKAAKAVRAVSAMRTAFPRARITGYEQHIEAMTVDFRDRHVAAAAYHARIGFIVTLNVKHFPPNALRPFNLRALHPDDFLMRCYRAAPETCAEIIRQQARDRVRPTRTPLEILSALAQLAPKFAAALRLHIGL